MFWRSKKPSQEASEQSLRRQQLRLRLLETLRSTTQFLIDEHHLVGWPCEKIWSDVERISRGIDLVLAEGLDAFGKNIPEPFRGGAIIAQSADAFSQTAFAIGDAKREQAVGSIGDAAATGHIFHQLGFGKKRRA